MPVAIKAAYGGGGRGLKVARTIEEIPELFESAVREAVGAFGRGECFVEKYLDKPRHVETQCLADSHGNVVVVSTRDCSLQRRHQKLVEEAPAPFLSDEQNAELYRASKAILREAGYVGAGTCEFLVGQDGTISFLEVNTRLQVEHPVTEEVTGIDLVREMFRIADGEALGYDDPVVRGHSIEFRINAEDAGRNFLPAPGHVTDVASRRPVPASGSTPASRRAARSSAPSTRCWPSWSSPGPPGQQALERSRRALAEFVVDGMPTVLPFHRAVVSDPAFAPAIGGRAVHGPHPVDRDRVRQHRPAVRRCAGRRRGAGRARARRRRGRRPSPRGRAPGGSRRLGRRRRPRQAGPPGGRRRRPVPRPAATR